jgi:hypothetical protein
MTAEELAFAQERLFAAGALDVYFTNIGMKKSRPAVMLTCMCRAEQREELLACLFRYTTSLGIREYTCSRYTLSREFETPVVVLSSLNRAGYKKRPTLESFKESGGVEYGSDIVLMLSFEMKDDYFIETTDEETGKKKRVYDYDRAKAESPRKMLLSLLKNRNGNPTGVVKVDSYSRYSLFTERGDSSQGPTA